MLRPEALTLSVTARMAAEAFCIMADPWLLPADLSQPGEGVGGAPDTQVLNSVVLSEAALPCACTFPGPSEVPAGAPQSSVLSIPVTCAFLSSIKDCLGAGETSGLLGIPLPLSLPVPVSSVNSGDYKQESDTMGI